jgi:hypothetical protein
VKDAKEQDEVEEQLSSSTGLSCGERTAAMMRVVLERVLREVWVFTPPPALPGACSNGASRRAAAAI